MILHQTKVPHREDCVKLSSRLEWFGISKLFILFSSVVDPCDKSTTYTSDSLKQGSFLKTAALEQIKKNIMRKQVRNLTPSFLKSFPVRFFPPLTLKAQTTPDQVERGKIILFYQAGLAVNICSTTIIQAPKMKNMEQLCHD